MFAEKEASTVREALRSAMSWPMGHPRPKRSEGAASSGGGGAADDPESTMTNTGWEFQRRFNRAREFVAQSPQDLLQKHAELQAISGEFARHVGSITRDFISRRLQDGVWSCDSNGSPVLDANRFTENASAKDHDVDGTGSSVSEVAADDVASSASQQLHSAEGAAVELLHDGIRYTLINHPSAFALLERSHENVLKAAAREVAGRTVVASVEPLREVVHVPMAAVLNFAGWGVFATTDLGLSQQTMAGGIYRTFPDQISRRAPLTDSVAPTKAFDHVQRLLSAQLYLRAHTSGTISTFIHSDAQLHLARDGKYYLTCMKRLLPTTVAATDGTVPAHTDPHVHESVCHRFRPELIRLYCPTQPLSSDSWMHLKPRGADAADIDILQASRVLVGRACHELAQRLLWFHDRDPDSPPETVARAARGHTAGRPEDAAGLNESAQHISPQHQRQHHHHHAQQESTALEESLPRVTFAKVDPATLKLLFHAYGVNLRYLGIVTRLVETALLERAAEYESREAERNAFEARAAGSPSPPSKTTKRRPQSSSSDGSDGDSLPERAASLRSAVLDCLRIEMVARAARDVLRREWRRFAAEFASAVGSGGSIDVGGTSYKARDVSFDALLEEWTLDWLMRISGDGLSYLGDSDAALWEQSLLPAVAEKFGYRMVFKRRPAPDQTAKGGAGAAGGIPPQATLNRVRRRPNGVDADEAASKALFGSAPLPSDVAGARALARRAASGREARTLGEIGAVPRRIVGVEATNWGATTDPIVTTSKSAVVHVGTDEATVRVQQEKTRLVSEWAIRYGLDAKVALQNAAGADKGGAADPLGGTLVSQGEDSESDDDDGVPRQPSGEPTAAPSMAALPSSSPSTLRGRDFAQSTVLNQSQRAGGANASPMALLIGPGGVSYSTLLDFCRPSEHFDDFAVRFGAMQDWRLVQRICDLTGVHLHHSSKSVLGFWCDIECSTKTVHAPPLDSRYVSAVLDGEFTEAEQRAQLEMRRRRRAIVVTVGGAIADLGTIDGLRRVAELHRFCGQTQLVAATLRKYREALQQDTGNHDLSVVPTLIAESEFELVRRNVNDAVDTAQHALFIADSSLKGTMVIARVLTQLLDAVDAQGFSDGSTKKRKSALVARLSRLTAQLHAPMAKIEAREAVLSATATFGPIFTPVDPDVELTNPSCPADRRIGEGGLGSSTSRRSSAATSRRSSLSSDYGDEAPGMSMRGGGGADDSGDTPDRAFEDDPDAPLAMALEPLEPLQPMALAVVHLNKERGLVDADTIGAFATWLCFRSCPAAVAAVSPRHGLVVGDSKTVPASAIDWPRLATAVRALTLFVSPSNPLYATTVSTFVSFFLSRLSAMGLCRRVAVNAETEPNAAEKMEAALASSEFSDLVGLATLLFRGYVRNLLSAVPKQHLHTPWRWDTQLSGSATALVASVHRLVLAPAFAIPVSTVVIDTITSLTNALAKLRQARVTLEPAGRQNSTPAPYFAIPFIADRAASYLNFTCHRSRAAVSAFTSGLLDGDAGGGGDSFVAFSETPPASSPQPAGGALGGRGMVSFAAGDMTGGGTGRTPTLGADDGPHLPAPGAGAAEVGDDSSGAAVVLLGPQVATPITGILHGTTAQLSHPTEPLLGAEDWLLLCRCLTALLREHGSTQPVFQQEVLQEVPVDQGATAASAMHRSTSGRFGPRAVSPLGDSRRTETQKVIVDTLVPTPEVLQPLAKTHWGLRPAARAQLLKAVLARQASVTVSIVPALDALRTTVVPVLHRSAETFADLCPNHKSELWSRVLAIQGGLHLAEAAAFVLPLPSGDTATSSTEQQSSGSATAAASSTPGADGQQQQQQQVQRRRITNPPEIPPLAPAVPPRERTVDELHAMIETLESMTNAGRAALGAMQQQRSYEDVLEATRRRLQTTLRAQSAARRDRAATAAASGGGPTNSPVRTLMRRRASLAPEGGLTPAPSLGSLGRIAPGSGNGSSESLAPKGTASRSAFKSGRASAQPQQPTTPSPAPDAASRQAPELIASPTRVYAGEPVSLRWAFPKAVAPRNAWIGIFPEHGPLTAATALAVYEGFTVRQLTGTIDVLMPPTLGDYRIAYFTTPGKYAVPHEGMVAEVYVLAPRNTRGPIPAPKKRNFTGHPSAEDGRGGPSQPANLVPSASPAGGASPVPVSVRPSWVPFDTERAKLGRLAGSIARNEATTRRATSPPASSSTPAGRRATTRLPPVPTAHTPPPRSEYVCSTEYSNEDREKARYQRRVLTLVRKQEKSVGRGNVTYIGGASGNDNAAFGVF